MTHNNILPGRPANVEDWFYKKKTKSKLQSKVILLDPQNVSSMRLSSFPFSCCFQRPKIVISFTKQKFMLTVLRKMQLRNIFSRNSGSVDGMGSGVLDILVSFRSMELNRSSCHEISCFLSGATVGQFAKAKSRLSCLISRRGYACRAIFLIGTDVKRRSGNWLSR